MHTPRTTIPDTAGVPARDSVSTDARNAVERPAIGVWITSALVFGIVVWMLYGIATNPIMDWSVIAQYFTFPTVMRGLLTTLQLTVIAMVLGSLGGILLATMRMSKNLLLRLPADLFVWFFRGTPVLVQLIFWFNIAIFVPEIAIVLPNGVELFHMETNAFVTPFVASLLGLALNEAAYMCEIVRGGLLSVPRGQVEASHSIGLGRFKSFFQILLPQAMKSIIPPTGNQVISMLKGTSLVSVIAMSDLLYSVQSIYNQNYQVIPLLVVACIWYLIATTILNFFQGRIEKHYGKGTR